MSGPIEPAPAHVWTQRRRVIWASLLWAMALPLVALLTNAAEGVAITAITTAGGVVTLIVGLYAGVAAWDDKNRSRTGVPVVGSVR